jgi:hypothetical protein
LYEDRVYTPQTFIEVVGTVDTEKRVFELFKAEFGSLPKMLRRDGQCNTSLR